jgi:hypothetical protein
MQFTSANLILTSLLSLTLASPLKTRESPTTWTIADFELTNNTGNGWTYNLQISGEAPFGGFNTACTGSTVQTGLAPCVQNSAVTAVVHSTGFVNGVEGFELQAGFERATAETPVTSGEATFEIAFVQG